MRLAPLDRGDARRRDRLRRVEIGLADLEVDDVPALCLERPGPREDLEGRLRAEPPHAARERAHFQGILCPGKAPSLIRRACPPRKCSRPARPPPNAACRRAPPCRRPPSG